MIINRLETVLDTLNAVEVRGRDNLNYQLGAIQELERVIFDLSKPKKPEKKEEDKNGRE